MFPDRSLIGPADWCDCCMAHDVAYWRGGTAQERQQADLKLKQCVLAATGDRVLARAMLSGVRAGGGPYFLTPFRWGYGWPFGRMYQPLSEQEQVQASSLLASSTASSPALACTKKSH